MNDTNIVRMQPADTLFRVRSATQEHPIRRISQEILSERIRITVTIEVGIVLFYICYHALQN
jgi:hypothetical protein